MPHQTPDSSKATSQNSATEPTMPSDGREPRDQVRDEPRSYVAADSRDASLAPPAAGEIGDFADEGDALGADDVQLGGTNTRRPEVTEVHRGQGPKTREANKRIVRGGSPD
jgi:hypothetical protein